MVVLPFRGLREIGRWSGEFGKIRPVDLLQGGVTEFIDRGVDHDMTGRQSNDAIGETTCQLDLMQADDRRDIVFAADAVDQFKNSSCRGGIETRHRFVGKNCMRMLRERPRDADALLLAAGQLVRPAQRSIQQLHPVERFESQPTLGVPRRQQRLPGGVERQSADQNVLQRREPADQMMLLKDHGGALAVTPQRRSAGEN